MMKIVILGPFVFLKDGNVNHIFEWGIYFISKLHSLLTQIFCNNLKCILYWRQSFLQGLSKYSDRFTVTCQMNKGNLIFLHSINHRRLETRGNLLWKLPNVWHFKADILCRKNNGQPYIKLHLWLKNLTSTEMNKQS